MNESQFDHVTKTRRQEMRRRTLNSVTLIVALMMFAIMAMPANADIMGGQMQALEMQNFAVGPAWGCWWIAPTTSSSTTVMTGSGTEISDGKNLGLTNSSTLATQSATAGKGSVAGNSLESESGAVVAADKKNAAAGVGSDIEVDSGASGKNAMAGTSVMTNDSALVSGPGKFVGAGSMTGIFTLNVAAGGGTASSSVDVTNVAGGVVVASPSKHGGHGGPK
jgi:hypothetical protein